jgi:hypothetical protein
MFEEVVEFKRPFFCVMGGKNTIVLQQKVPKAKVWAIAKTFTFVLNCIVIACVMNQS